MSDPLNGPNRHAYCMAEIVRLRADLVESEDVNELAMADVAKLRAEIVGLKRQLNERTGQRDYLIEQDYKRGVTPAQIRAAREAMITDDGYRAPVFVGAKSRARYDSLARAAARAFGLEVSTGE